MKYSSSNNHRVGSNNCPIELQPHREKWSCDVLTGLLLSCSPYSVLVRSAEEEEFDLHIAVKNKQMLQVAGFSKRGDINWSSLQTFSVDEASVRQCINQLARTPSPNFSSLAKQLHFAQDGDSKVNPNTQKNASITTNFLLFTTISRNVQKEE